MRILLWCDALPEVGIGHVVRCLALAEEALARGHEVDLLGRIEGALALALSAATTGLRLLGAPPDDADQLAEVLGRYDHVHVDAYDIGDLTDVLARCEQHPALSSMHDGTFGLRRSDLLVDPTPGAEVTPAPVPSGWTLRGARYAPIRRSVLAQAGTATDTPQSGLPRVLVVLGGTDPTASAPHVARALLATELPVQATVIASAGTRADLDELAAGSDGRLLVIDPVANVASLVSGSDLVVTAAGSTVWEVCALRRSMAVVTAADNQVSGYQHLVESGAALGLGDVAQVRDLAVTSRLLATVLTDRTLRESLAEAAHRLVDGLGCWRVVSSWEELFAGASSTHDPRGLRVRPATEEDAESLWSWRNDPATRSLSRSAGPLAMEDHVRWLETSLVSDDRVLLLAEDDGGKVGTVRWDLHSPGEWEVSITVAPERRGEGLARPLLAVGEDALRHRSDVVRLLAVVHVDNARSQRLFTTSGYLPDLPADARGFTQWTKLVT